MTISAVTAGAIIDPAWGNSVADFINNIKAAYIATSQTTASTSYVDLATVGPQVSCTTGTSALVFVQSYTNNTLSTTNYIGIAVSGATTIAASDAKAVYCTELSTGSGETMAGLVLITGLTAGVNTFTLKYKVLSGTGTYVDRTIAVVPLSV